MTNNPTSETNNGSELPTVDETKVLGTSSQSNLDSPLPRGVWIRRVFNNAQDGKKKVRVSFVPDDSSKDPEQLLKPDDQDADLGEDAKWTEFLGEQLPANFDLDSGTSILRLTSDENSGVVIWLPNDSSNNTITSYFLAKEADDGDGVTIKKFRKCMKAQLANRKTYAQAWRRCIDQL